MRPRELIDTRSGVDNEVFDEPNGAKILAEPTDYGSIRGSIPLSGAKINNMIKFEIEYYKNIEKQVKLLERIAKSLEIIAKSKVKKITN